MKPLRSALKRSVLPPPAASPGLRLQRAALNRNPLPAVPPLVRTALQASGRPLEAATRSLMEPRFGYDFSRVRVHTDANAAESARAVHALAYTVGQDIVFGTGRYAPATVEGRRLLAHELAHVVQQGGFTPPMRHPAGTTPAGQQGGFTPPMRHPAGTTPAGQQGAAFDSTPSLAIGVQDSDRHEQAAEAAAEGFTSGASRQALEGGASAGIQRAEETGKNQAPGQTEDVCAKQENDPESFTILAAKHFLTEVDPGASQLAKTVTCEAASPDGDRMECDVTFSDGGKIHVTWIKSLNNVEAQRPTPDGRQWCVYHYVCDPSGEVRYEKKGCSSNVGGKPAGSAGPTMVGAAAGGSAGRGQA